MSRKIDRTGEEGYNREGILMRIVEYKNTNDILIEFQDKYKAMVHTNYQAFKKGGVKNPYHPSVFNIGFLGIGKHKAEEKGKQIKAYKVWVKMLQRCYDPYYLNEHPTYRDCYVCEEWHNFQNFGEWWEYNVYNCNNEKMCLDKDILVKGNKVYSPETCIIVPERINLLFVKKDVNRGDYPIGVDEWLNKINGDKWLKVRCSTLEKRKHLGYFPLNRPFQAFTVYKNFKEKYIKQIADEYKEFIPKKLYDALYKYEVEIND